MPPTHLQIPDLVPRPEMTKKEVSEFLRVSYRGINDLIEHHGLPVTFIGNRMRFSRQLVNDWLLRNTRNVAASNLASNGKARASVPREREAV